MKKSEAWTIATVALALAACGRGDARDRDVRGNLTLHLRGTSVTTLPNAGAGKIAAENVTAQDPHEHRALAFRGVRVTSLLDAALGPSWRTEQDVVFTCADGFRPTVPVKLLLLRDAFLAYAREGSSDFAVQEDGKPRAVGPYYLVWKEAPGQDPPEPDWPYQVTGLDVTSAEARIAPATLPPAASALAREGFETFRTFCLPCHTINGSGGGVAPELNYPVSVTEYFAEPVLRQWIADPKQVRWNAKMLPPFPPGTEQAHAIDAIVAYLDAMAGAKRAPQP